MNFAHLLVFAIFSISSFFLIEKHYGFSFSQLMISSAKTSATVLLFLNAVYLTPIVIKKIAQLTLLKGDTSTACFLTTPPAPILVESSLAPAFYNAPTYTSNGFLPVIKLITSKACFTILMDKHFFPLFLPWNINAFTNLSTIGQFTFLNLLMVYLPEVWGTRTLTFY